MKSGLYLALLRGINVGGNNIIKMSDLRECFENADFKDVTTYIQSGNVIFSTKTPAAKLTSQIEKMLSKQFKYNSRVVIVSHSQLKTIISKAPKSFGVTPEKLRYDVIFLKEPVKPKEAIKVTKAKVGVDSAFAGKHTLYYSRLISKASQSQLSRIIQDPLYQFMTIRNWNTSTKLLALMDELNFKKHQQLTRAHDSRGL